MKFSNKKILILFATFIFIILLIFINNKIFVAEVTSHSMNNTLFQSDYILYKRIDKSNYQTITRNDILIFERNGRFHIKRCIGLPGDTIEIIQNNSVIVNGKSFIEKKSVEKTKVKKKGYSELLPKKEIKDSYLIIPKKGHLIQKTKKNLTKYQYLIEQNESNFFSIDQNNQYYLEESNGYYNFKNNYYFLIGDNRNYSIDSRNYGPVKEKDIVGKFIFKF